MFIKALFAALALTCVAHANPVITSFGHEGVFSVRATAFLPDAYEKKFPNHQAAVAALVELQTSHILGIMEQPPFTKINRLTPNENLGPFGFGPLIGFKVVNEMPSSTGEGTEISYMVRHKILVRDNAMQPGSRRTVKVVVPHSPVEFYARACTDKTYPQKEYLFYFWNPFDRECMTKLTGKNQVDTLNAEVQVGTQDQQYAGATPDYKALAKQIREQGQLKIALLFGLDGHSTNPNDAGRRSYEFFQRLLEKSGFERERGKNIPTGPFTEYVRPASGGKFSVRVSLSLSASDVNTPVVFARRARNAFENYDIVDYVGHSGLGGNLDLTQIARLSSPDPSHPLPIRFPHKYQILFLNSCASFFFYSREYSHLWFGAKHMDLITNGVATYFHTQDHETVNFLDAFANPKRAATWLEILGRIEEAHPQFHYMINVMPLR